MPTEVTDPNILSQLNGPQEVTDPGILAQLNAQPSSSPLAWVKGAGQAAGAIGAGALKGLNSSLNRLLPGENLQPKIDADPVFNYTPGSPEGQAILGTIGKIASPITNTLKAVKQDIASATSPKVADTIGDLATVATSYGALGGIGGGAKAAQKSADIAPEASEALDAGLKLTPEQVGNSPVGNAVQSLSGSAKLERSISKSNAETVTNLAKDEIGIPRNAPLNESAFNNAKVPHNAVYNQVSKLGNVVTDSDYAREVAGISDRTGSGSFGFDVPPAIQKLKDGYGKVSMFDAGDAVAKVRQLRADASKNIKAFNQPEQNALGYAQKQIAQALENQLERHVQALSEAGAAPSNLIDQLRDARVQLAKIHSVQDAMDGGNVSAIELGKQLERGVPLSGKLKTVAQAANNYSRSFQDVSKIRDSGPFGVLDLGFGVGAGLSHPLAASAVLARPLARAALASGPYQRALTSPGLPPGLLNLARPGGLLLSSEQQQGLLGNE